MKCRWPAAAMVVLGIASSSTAALPLQDLAKKVGPSVVHLSIRDADGEEHGSGSGFVISADGQVATNFHVVEGAERIVAVFADGRQIDVVGVRIYDEDADIAVLQLGPGEYSPLTLASLAAHPGDDVVVLGSPRGLGHSLSTGIVAAFREHGTVTAANKDGMKSWQLQITATIAPGSSGSPILNGNGEVLGLAVGRMDAGLYFGIPVAKLKTLLDKKTTEVKPLATVHGGRSVGTNLLISAGLFSALGLAAWIRAVVQRRRRTPPTGWSSLGR